MRLSTLLLPEILAAGLIVLCACGTMGKTPPPVSNTTDAASGCPVPVEYSVAQQAQAAAELRGLPKDSTLGVFMSDYARLRGQARGCAHP